MERSEFLKFVAATPFAGLLTFENGEPKPKSKEDKEKLDELHELFRERKPLKIAGFDFVITEWSIQSNGRGRQADIELVLRCYAAPTE